MSRIRTIIIFGVLILSVAVHEASAARIGEIVETDPWNQMKRFITLSDRGLRLSLIGALLFGAVCGLLGSFPTHSSSPIGLAQVGFLLGSKGR